MDGRFFSWKTTEHKGMKDLGKKRFELEFGVDVCIQGKSSWAFTVE